MSFPTYKIIKYSACHGKSWLFVNTADHPMFRTTRISNLPCVSNLLHISNLPCVLNFQLLDIRIHLAETFPKWAKLGMYQIKEGPPKDFLYLSMLHRFMQLKDVREAKKQNSMAVDTEGKRNLMNKLEAMEKAFLEKGKQMEKSTSTSTLPAQNKPDTSIMTSSCNDSLQEKTKEDDEEVRAILEVARPSPSKQHDEDEPKMVTSQNVKNRERQSRYDEVVKEISSSRDMNKDKNNKDSETLQLEVKSDHDCDVQNNMLLGIKSAEEQNVTLINELNQERT